MLLPTAPILTNAVAGAMQVTLQWQDVSNAESFDLFWNTSGNVSDSDPYVTHVTSPFTHTPLVDGQSYYYRLRARNSSGVSVLSNEVTVTPPNTAQVTPPGALPTTPAGVQIALQNGQLTLNWDTAADAKAYNLY